MAADNSSDAARKPLRRTIRGGRPMFFADPAIDKVLNMVITLGSEVWALRERLMAMEALQVRTGSLGATDVDDYDFTPEQEARLGGERKEFIDNLFRVLQEQVEAAAAKSPSAREHVSRQPGVFGARVSSVSKKSSKKPKKKSPAKKPSAKKKSRR